MRRSPAAEGGGFTLVELLAVMLLIAVVMGIGVGALRSAGGGLDGAVAVVREQVRTARDVARHRASPTRVYFERAAEEAPARVRSVLLAPVGQWSFEDASGRGAPDLPPAHLGGRIVEHGRFGRALEPPAEVGGEGLRLSTRDLAAFDLAEGFSLRVDVLLQEPGASLVARLGESFQLAIGEDLVPHGRVVVRGPAGGPGRRLAVRGAMAMTPGRWTTLELAFDRRHARLAMDGIERLSPTETGPLHQERGADFVLSDPTAPLAGLLDECLLLAYEDRGAQALPGEVELVEAPPVLYFNSRGEVDPEHHPGLVRIVLARGDQRRELVLEPGGILR